MFYVIDEGWDFRTSGKMHSVLDCPLVLLCIPFRLGCTPPCLALGKLGRCGFDFFGTLIAR